MTNLVEGEEMKHIGLAVYLGPHSIWWSGDNGCYLLSEYESHEKMCEIAEYQDKRVYDDELFIYNTQASSAKR